MKLPKIDIKELKKQKDQNFKDRLEFIKLYARWVKKKPNNKWSLQHKHIVG